jgi:hypothetical protein
MIRLGAFANNISVTFLATAILAVAIFPAQGNAQPASLQQVNVNGFGDFYNTIAWSMVWWNNQLYVGTDRATGCVFAVYHKLAYPPSDPDLTCPPDPADIPLQAEIWRYTPATQLWERVYQAPQTPIPGMPGKFVGADIGYRYMAVFQETSGVQALYVSGVSARFLYPDLPAPRILRTTDGINFAPLPQDPGTVLASTSANNFRSIAIFNNKFYVTAGDYWGDGPLLEATNPEQGDNAFRYVTPQGMRVFSVVPFNNQLYVGTTDLTNGYGVYRTAATGTPPYTFTPVVTDSAYNPTPAPQFPHSVISMEVFDNSLYAGSDAGLDLIRVHPDDSWDLIVGAQRQAPQGQLSPLSGLGPSYRWPYNILTWQMGVYNNALYIGTFDASTFQKDNPTLGPELKPYMGAKLYVTRDGVDFLSLAHNFFDGDYFNYGIRSFAATPMGFFIGSANDWYGTEVWLLQQ